MLTTGISFSPDYDIVLAFALTAKPMCISYKNMKPVLSVAYERGDLGWVFLSVTFEGPE